MSLLPLLERKYIYIYTNIPSTTPPSPYIHPQHSKERTALPASPLHGTEDQNISYIKLFTFLLYSCIVSQLEFLLSQ